MSNPAHYPPERDFLITLALKEFNSQYHRDIKPEDCTVVSIAPKKYFESGYEITTTRTDDRLKIQMHLNFSSVTSVSPCYIENVPTLDDNPDDGEVRHSQEVFVLCMELDSYFVEQDIYKFRWLDAN